jgi:hypothetical protein
MNLAISLIDILPNKLFTIGNIYDFSIEIFRGGGKLENKVF